MASPSNIQFLKIAGRIRQALGISKEPEAANEALVNENGIESTLEPTGIAQAQENQSSASRADLNYLFDETGVRVSSTTIEFGNFTYVLKHLASTNRIDDVPPRTLYKMGIVLTLVALLILIIYIFTGQITFGKAAVFYLLAGLLAFIISVLAYWQLEPSHTLVFKDVSGAIVKSIVRRDKAVIDRLEKAVKLAVSRNNKAID